ncbi:MAG: hypothetical protein V1838_02040 [Patescibacteria group bacterium]
MNIIEDFNAKMDGARNAVKIALPTVSRLSDKQIAIILFTWQELVGNNFNLWLMQTYLNCRNREAKNACGDILWQEINCCQQELLVTMLKPLWGNKQLISGQLENSIREGEKYVEEILQSTREGVLYGLIAIQTFQEAATEFVPWLRAAVDKAGLKELSYIEVNDVTDEIGELKRFYDALNAELDQSAEPPGFDVEAPINQVVALLQHIFRSHEMIK